MRKWFIRLIVLSLVISFTVPVSCEEIGAANNCVEVNVPSLLLVPNSEGSFSNGYVVVDYLYTGHDAEKILNDLLDEIEKARLPELSAGEHYELIQYHTDLDIENDYIDIRIYSNDESLESHRTYDILSQVEMDNKNSGEFVVYSNLFCLYVVPDTCDDYILTIGIVDEYLDYMAYAAFDVRNGIFSKVEYSVDEAEQPSANKILYFFRFILIVFLVIVIILLIRRIIYKFTDKEYVFMLVICFIVSVIPTLFPFGYVTSGSMEPTLRTKEIILSTRLFNENNISRGDIVTFKRPEYEEGKTNLTKRVVALEGDCVSFKDGYLYINGNKVDESDYLSPDIETNSPKEFVVPEDCVFVLGDNREDSYDSRFWENPFVNKSQITDKYLFTLLRL